MRGHLAVSVVPILAVLGILAAPVPRLPGFANTARPDLPGPFPVRQDPGIPVTGPEVIANCSTCHLVDDAGRMGRISYLRKTPEGWQRSLLRMMSLQGVQLDPETARRIVRYLSDDHGLAPEELRPASWEVERRVVPNEAPNEIIRETCTACHSVGRILTQRRTAEEWRLLTETHRAYYPLIDNQIYRDADGTAEDPFPVNQALDYLADAYPLITPEWARWSSSVRVPRLEGSWALEGWEVGRGPVFGTVEISASAEGEFTTRTTYTYPRDRSTVSREGEVLIYTGYQWRGRSQETSRDGAAGTVVGANGELREVMLVEPDWSEASGRWFTGAYDELGLEVTLRRVGADPVLTGVYPEAMRQGAQVDVRIFGANLSPGLDPGMLDLGPGIEVESVATQDDRSLIATIAVDGEAVPGPRDVHLGPVTLTDAFAVFDEVTRLVVGPSMGMARVGGANLPKQYERFEAIGYASGADGEPGTEDDLRLGLMDVSWAVEEYPVSFDDDDVEFVGELSQGGVFTPAEDGPNPERVGDRNNIGDVWVTASYTPEGATGRTLTARAQLVVTVPLYLRWDLSGVNQELDLEVDR